MPTGECQALLFDVGNVVVEVDFMRVLEHWSRSSGQPVERLRERFGPDVHYERHERGEIDAPAYFASLRASLGIELSDAEFRDGWNAVFVDEVPGIRDVLARAGRHLPLYAFSNTNAMHYVEWSTRFADLFRPFQRIFASCDIAQRKPERGAYDTVARSIGVPAAQILFFDDAEENVHGARAAGMQAVRVNAIDDVRAALEDNLGERW